MGLLRSSILLLCLVSRGTSGEIVGKFSAVVNGSTSGVTIGELVVGGFSYDSDSGPPVLVTDDFRLEEFDLEYPPQAVRFMEYPGTSAWYELLGERVDITEDVVVRINDQLPQTVFAPQDLFQIDGPGFQFTLFENGSDSTLVTSFDLPTSDKEINWLAGVSGGKAAFQFTSADVLSYSLNPVPEPDLATMVFTGLILTGFFRARFRTMTVVMPLLALAPITSPARRDS